MAIRRDDGSMIAVEMPDLCRIQDVGDYCACNADEVSGAFEATSATFTVEIKVTGSAQCCQ